jgi:hypothetical protein
MDRAFQTVFALNCFAKKACTGRMDPILDLSGFFLHEDSCISSIVVAVSTLLALGIATGLLDDPARALTVRSCRTTLGLRHETLRGAVTLVCHCNEHTLLHVNAKGQGTTIP